MATKRRRRQPRLALETELRVFRIKVPDDLGYLSYWAKRMKFDAVDATTTEQGLPVVEVSLTGMTVARAVCDTLVMQRAAENVCAIRLIRREDGTESRY